VPNIVRFETVFRKVYLQRDFFCLQLEHATEALIVRGRLLSELRLVGFALPFIKSDDILQIQNTPYQMHGDTLVYDPPNIRPQSTDSGRRVRQSRYAHNASSTDLRLAGDI
jgi:hypothetical protein